MLLFLKMNHSILLLVWISGTIYFLDDRGKCKKCYQLENPVKYLLYHESRDAIVVVTENLMLSQHSLQPDGEYSEISKVCIVIIEKYCFITQSFMLSYEVIIS